MKILRAKSAGFCRGVERAIRIARECAHSGKAHVFTDGPLIHNTQMVEELAREGVSELGDFCKEGALSEEEKAKSVIIVRAHGVAPQRREQLKKLGMEFRDATCQDVASIAAKVKVYSGKGYSTIVFGDSRHPEVVGILGHATGKSFAVKTLEDIAALPEDGAPFCMVSQSTMHTDEFERLAVALKERFPASLAFNTICSATRDRQSDVHVLVSEGAEAIVVIGGKHSANTVKLVELVERHNVPCFHVETPQELDLKALSRYSAVGVTAGASTPGFLIDEVCNALSAL